MTVTSRWIAAHTKPCIIFSPRWHRPSQRVVPLVTGIWLQPMPTLALRSQKMKRTGMMSPSHPCLRCWPAARSPTSPTPVPPLAGCPWKVIPQHTSLRVPRFLRGHPSRSLGESTLNGKQAAVSRAVLPPQPPPPRSSPARSRAS